MLIQVPVIKILAMNKGQVEIIDECNNHDDAWELVQQYRLSFGPDWHIYQQTTGRILAPKKNGYNN